VRHYCCPVVESSITSDRVCGGLARPVSASITSFVVFRHVPTDFFLSPLCFFARVVE
jgi:hypothetical protein